MDAIAILQAELVARNKAAWRKWFTEGRQPARKPIYDTNRLLSPNWCWSTKDEAERLRTLARPVLETSVRLPPDWPFPVGIEDEKEFLRDMHEDHRLIQQYYATPEGQFERADTLLEKAAQQDARYSLALTEPARYRILALSAPQRETLTRLQTYWRTLIEGYEIGGPDEILRRYNADPNGGHVEEYGGDPIYNKKGTIVDYQDRSSELPAEMDTYNTILSSAKAAMWKLEAEGWTAPYLTYVDAAEGAGIEPLNRKQYMKLQLKARKAQKLQSQRVKSL